MPLTETKIKNAKAGEKQTKIFDVDGLFLLVAPTGKGGAGKRWRLKYYFNGKEKLLALGTYPEVTLADARTRRDQARQLIANGIDPGDMKKQLKAEQEEKAANTFRALAESWHKHQAGVLSEHTRERTLGRLTRDAFPVIGDTPLADLTPRIILEKVLRPIEKRGNVETAHRVRGTIGQILRFGVAEGRCDRDVTADLRGALKPIQREHFAGLDSGGTTDPAKVGALLRAIEGFDGSPVVKAALKLHPLVVVRPGELRSAEWCEIDLDAGEWNIPAGKMKGRLKLKHPHLVPLSSAAVAVLRELHPLTGAGKYLFPSVRSTSRPISENTLNAALRRLGYTKEEIVSHGWRSIFRTLGDEVLQERPDIIEAQLAHKVIGPLGRAYNRTSFLKERRELMEKWGAYLEGLKAGAKVIPIKRRA